MTATRKAIETARRNDSTKVTFDGGMVYVEYGRMPPAYLDRLVSDDTFLLTVRPDETPAVYNLTGSVVGSEPVPIRASEPTPDDVPTADAHIPPRIRKWASETGADEIRTHKTGRRAVRVGFDGGALFGPDELPDDVNVVFTTGGRHNLAVDFYF